MNSFFDILNNDLLIIIINKLNTKDDIDNLKESYSFIDELLLESNVWKIMFISRFNEEYNNKYKHQINVNYERLYQVHLINDSVVYIYDKIKDVKLESRGKKGTASISWDKLYENLELNKHIPINNKKEHYIIKYDNLNYSEKMRMYLIYIYVKEIKPSKRNPFPYILSYQYDTEIYNNMLMNTCYIHYNSPYYVLIDTTFDEIIKDGTYDNFE